MDTLNVVVRRIRQEALEVKSFELVRADGAALPPFTPGAHIDVHVEPGMIRQYSLCSEARETDRYVIAVKNEPDSRGGSRAMHQRVKEGDTLAIGNPRNNFALVPAAHYLLIAGGIGITPLLSMSRHLLREGAAFELLYFSRSIAHTAFHDVLAAVEYAKRVSFHYALEPDQVRAYLRRVLWHRRDGAHLYLCGPRPFMDLVETTAAPTWPPESVHLEYFVADSAALAGPREDFVVRLARSGAEYRVPPDRSIVEVLADHGVAIQTSCEQGVCGTCLTGVLEGEPDHRDVFLTDAEKHACDKMTPCVSRSRSARLVLDI